MPQIGWFEILIVIVLAILIIGPKDFPIMLRKVGGWVSSIKKYFSEIQKEISEMERSVEDEISLKEKYPSPNKDKKDEWW